MSSSSPPAAETRSSAALSAQALSLCHREPGQALTLADAAAACALTAEARRRALATRGICLCCIPAEAARGQALLQEALAECAAAGDDLLRCEVLRELGSSYANTSQFAAASTHLREAVALAQEQGRPDEQARALRALGGVLSNIGDFQEALATLLEALELHQALTPQRVEGLDDLQRWERGKLFGRIAVVYSNLDQCERSLAYHQVALESFGGRYPLAAARTLYRMAIAAEEMRDHTRSEHFYGECLRAYAAEGNDAGRALGLMGLGKLRLRRGEVAAAGEMLEQAVEILARDPAGLGYYADALWSLGDVELARGAAGEALARYQQALPLFHATERPGAHRAELHGRFSRALEALGRHAEALEHYQEFHRLREAHLEEQANAKLAGMMAQFDTERALQEREIHRLRNIELEREIAERKEAEAALARAQAELERINRELRALTVRDPLTGVFNRRYLDQRLAEAMPLAVRRVQPLSVMMCDIDDFKRINDSFSHATGDQVLREVATLLREHVRQSDVVARFGGEEFVVLYPATRLEQAVAASEKICALVREHPWAKLDPALKVTISAGVAAAAGHATHEKLLSEADRRLYLAKAAGKDRVVATSG